MNQAYLFPNTASFLDIEPINYYKWNYYFLGIIFSPILYLYFLKYVNLLNQEAACQKNRNNQLTLIK